MAQDEHPPIYKAAFDLQIYFEGIVKNFSCYHKYTHGISDFESRRGFHNRGVALTLKGEALC